MINTDSISSHTRKYGSGIQLAFSLAAIALLAMLTLRSSLHSGLSPEQTLQVLGVGIALLLVLWSVYAAVGKADTSRLVFNLALVVWTFLLVSQEIFDYATDNDTAVGGNFVTEAYGQAVLWLFALPVLLGLSMLRPQFLRLVKSRSFRWAWLLTAFCVLSVGYAPNPMYSLAWSFKLLMVVWVTTILARESYNIQDLEKVFRATLWGVAFLAFMPVARALADPSTAFSGVGGRLNVNPVELSGVAGALLVLAVMLYTIRPRRSLTLIAFLSGSTMLLAFGKTGIIAGTLSAMLFLILQKKYVAAFGVLALVGILGGVLVAVTPLSSYLKSYEGLDTLTGRTSIWESAIEGIEQAPILGHGYVSSRAFAPELPGKVGIAEHMHNGFIEVWFDNGLIGLLALLAMQGATVRNLIVAQRLASRHESVNLRGSDPRTARLLAMGSLALFFNLIVNGLFNSSFGGRAIGPYMLMIALLMMSETLRRGLEFDAAQTTATHAA